MFQVYSNDSLLYLCIYLLHPVYSMGSLSCLNLCNSMNCSSSVHGIFQVRILEWATIFYSGYLPDPEIELVSLECPALAGGFLYHWATWETHIYIWVCVYIYTYIFIYIYIFVFRFFSIRCYYKILNIVHSAISRSLLFILYVVVCTYYSLPLSPSVTISLHSMSVSLFLVWK